MRAPRRPNDGVSGSNSKIRMSLRKLGLVQQVEARIAERGCRDASARRGGRRPGLRGASVRPCTDSNRNCRYASQTSLLVPSIWIRPRSSQIVRSHKLITAVVSWVTKSSVPRCLNARRKRMHFCVNKRVAHGQRLVDDQDVGIDMGHHGKREADLHAARIRLDRVLDEIADVGELADAVIARFDLARRQSQQLRIEQDVLAPGELGIEAGAELQHRGDPPARRHGTRGRNERAAENLQQRRLARTIAPDDADGLAGADVERDIAQAHGSPRRSACDVPTPVAADDREALRKGGSSCRPRALRWRRQRTSENPTRVR